MPSVQFDPSVLGYPLEIDAGRNARRLRRGVAYAPGIGFGGAWKNGSTIADSGVFIVGMVVMFGVNLVTNLAAGIAESWSAWWSPWALIGWSAGLAIHGLVVWLNRPMLPAG